MKWHIVFAATLLIAIGSRDAWAADSSPQPTTSPTNSGKSSGKPAADPELDQFVKARTALSKSIAEFNAVVANSKSGTRTLELGRLKKEINRQAGNILQYARSNNNAAAE